MAGFLDWIGSTLDRPLQGVGIDTREMNDPERWGYRGRVLSALGNSIGTTNRQNFHGLLDDMAASRQQQLQAQQSAQQQAELQRTMQQIAQSGDSPADAYMRYAQVFASRGDAAKAKTYFEMARSLQQKPDEEEYGQPVAVVGPDGRPSLAQFGKRGNVRPVDGFGPKPEAPAASPTSIQEYEYAVRQGFKGTFAQFQQEQRRAGATNVSVGGAQVSIDPNKKLGDTLGSGVGEFITNSHNAALTGQSTLGTVSQIRNSLGNAITGPFADQRAFLARLQSGLGLAPAETPERLADTRRVIQGLAQAELNAAQAMKGQGSLTENEREIIRRAAAGTIDMSPTEIRSLVDVMERAARSRIDAHTVNLNRLRKVPGAETIIPFYELDQPTSAPPGGLSVQDAARREIERRRGGR